MILRVVNKHNYRKAVQICTAFWFILYTVVAPQSIKSEEPGDTTSIELQDIIVTTQGRTPYRKAIDGSVSIHARDISRISRTFGESDFINQIRQLSGISSSGDYSSGLVIDGDDPTTVQYLLNGAQVLFPYRFGGIFSTFNTSHFSSMRFSRRSGSSLSPRLGGAFEFTPATRFESGAEGVANIGMIASSLSVRAGIADKLSISLSGRISYIDQVYGKLLSSKRAGIGYSFRDINANVSYRTDSCGVLSADLFLSSDKVGYDDHNYSLITDLHWTNALYNIGYQYIGPTEVKANVYYSSFFNTMMLTMPQFQLVGPSSFDSAGGNITIGNQTLGRIISDWNTGITTTYNHGIPQYASLQMSDADDGLTHRSSESMPQRMFTITAFGKTVFPILPERIKLSAELAVSYFSSCTAKGTDYSKMFISPQLCFNLNIPEGMVDLTVARLCQPLHQVGFSELGLASNFWIGACHEAPMQEALSISASANRYLPWLGLKLELSAYFKTLRNQAEYQGQVIETIDTDYNPFSHLIMSDGYNYGFSAGLSKPFGSITGDANYSYGDGRRHSVADRGDSWKALYAEGHTLKAGLVWHEGRHWELSVAFRLSSGRRYTPVKSLYLIGGNIAIEYGGRNSARLPMYQRLDAGATYYFLSGCRRKLRHLINISLLNLYGHRNVEMQYFVLSSSNGEYALKRLYSLYRFIPSLSYTIEF